MRLTLLEDPTNKDAHEKMRKTVSGINGFHEIIWLYQEAGDGTTGRWKFHQVYAAEADKDYKPIQFTADKLRAFLAKSPMRDTTIRLVHPFQPDDAPLAADGHTIMAMTKALELGRADKGVLIAVPKLKRVMESVWTQTNSFLERVSVYDEALAKNIYTEKRAVPVGFFNPIVNGDVLVRAGDNMWNVRINFLRSPKMLFIAYMPYLAMIFGLCFTALGAFYVYSNQKKSAQMSGMNMTAIIDSVTDVIFETNNEGEILFLSAAWTKITGFEVEQSLGQDIFAMLSPQYHEENRRDFDALGTRRAVFISLHLKEFI